MPQTSTEYFGAVKDTVQSFWHGLSVTLSYMMRRPITTQYPDRTPLAVRDTLPPRYRGLLEVDPDVCTGCQACERACPIGCIQINLEKDAANPKQRVVSQFDIDEAKCMFCGLCVEPCPTGAIQHSREFEGTSRSVRNLTIRWADPLKPFPVYKVDKNATYYPRAPLGSLIRAKLEGRAWDAAAPVFLPPEPVKPAAPKAAAAKAAAPAPAGEVKAAKAAPAKDLPVATPAGAPPPNQPAVDMATIVAQAAGATAPAAAPKAPVATPAPTAAPKPAADPVHPPKPPTGTP